MEFLVSQSGQQPCNLTRKSYGPVKESAVEGVRVSPQVSSQLVSGNGDELGAFDA
jgi:hypothetical protein